jgi:predicted ATP-grasp superfamily ATP-dependent carboligase
MSILIVSQSDDVHAVSVKSALRKRGFSDCFLIETDRISNTGDLSLEISNCGTDGHVNDAEGNSISVSEAKVLWMRRFSPTQRQEPDIAKNESQELIDNDCGGAVCALFDICFRGKWISDPDATIKASNKLYQLNVARQCGFKVPDTLISQDKGEVMRFFERHQGKVVVKPVVGMASRFLLTRALKHPDRIDKESYKRSPAIYQEYIAGTRHIRLNCFGDHSYAASIESNAIDWRPNLTVSMNPWPVPDRVHAKVREVLDKLGLAMGVIDIKEDPEGTLVWFEVNPQGQFLFLEPLTGLQLTKHFAEFLVEEWEKA